MINECLKEGCHDLTSATSMLCEKHADEHAKRLCDIAYWQSQVEAAQIMMHRAECELRELNNK